MKRALNGADKPDDKSFIDLAMQDAACSPRHGNRSWVPGLQRERSLAMHGPARLKSFLSAHLNKRLDQFQSQALQVAQLQGYKRVKATVLHCFHENHEKVSIIVSCLVQLWHGTTTAAAAMTAC